MLFRRCLQTHSFRLVRFGMLSKDFGPSKPRAHSNELRRSKTTPWMGLSRILLLLFSLVTRKTICSCPGVTYHTCDISSSADVERVFAEAKPEVIFHVACPDSTVQQPAAFQRVNVIGARNLLTAARNVRTLQAFVDVTTSSVIHDNLTDLVDADETLMVLKYSAQKRVYTLTKAEAEVETLSAKSENGDPSMLTVSFRPATAFGEQRDTIYMGKIVANARAGKEKLQMGPGANLYDFVYISNLVDLHILAADALVRAYGKPLPPSDMRVYGESFNVTNDERPPSRT
ncbi:hypothetical protein F4804DRAFT_215930 [Jackrogersella minutella]|nr:hypothetical protein F4804DRAFT_215930 [Jackrogersella minutella]